MVKLKATPPTPKFKTIGEAADAVYAMRSERLDLERKVEQMKKREGDLSDAIRTMLKKQKLEKASGELCTVSIGSRPVAKVDDWDKFYEFIRKNDAFDLLERRPAAKALEDRIEHGQKVGGVSLEHLERLSIGKAGS